MIYLVRHGETLWNRARRMQGHLDSPLTARGEDQARRMGEALRALVGDGFAMVSSPLGRARRTAAIIGAVLERDPAACRSDDRLREMTWGEWDGLTRDEIEARDPGELARRRHDKWNYVPPGGESYEMLANRVAHWLDDIEPGARLIVVAHGGVGRVLRGLHARLASHETLALDQPQDAFFRLRDGCVDRGGIDRIDIAPPQHSPNGAARDALADGYNAPP